MERWEFELGKEVLDGLDKDSVVDLSYLFHKVIKAYDARGKHVVNDMSLAIWGRMWETFGIYDVSGSLLRLRVNVGQYVDNNFVR